MITRQLIGFVCVGAVGTAAHYAVLLTGVRFGADPVLASAAGAATGAVINYILNYKLVFRMVIAHRRSAPRFVVLGATSFGINTALMFIAVKALALQYLIAQVAITFIVLVWNFLLSRAWVFQSDQHDRLHTNFDCSSRL